jgi:hypothetical protein
LKTAVHFACFVLSQDQNKLFSSKPLSGSMKSTAASLFFYCFKKCPIFRCFMKCFVKCFHRCFAKCFVQCFANGCKTSEKVREINARLACCAVSPFRQQPYTKTPVRIQRSAYRYCSRLDKTTPRWNTGVRTRVAGLNTILPGII